MTTDDERETGLERQLVKTREHNARLKAQLRGMVFREVGFDPDSARGKALGRLYDGPPDPDQIRQFVADEFPEWSTDHESH